MNKQCLTSGQRVISTVLAAWFVLASPLLADASPAVFEKKFSNCAALNKVFPGGVAKSKATVNKGGKIKNTPTVDPKTYKENASKDRDKDGIACEQ